MTFLAHDFSVQFISYTECNHFKHYKADSCSPADWSVHIAMI